MEHNLTTTITLTTQQITVTNGVVITSDGRRLIDSHDTPLDAATAASLVASNGIIPDEYRRWGGKIIPAHVVAEALRQQAELSKIKEETLIGLDDIMRCAAAWYRYEDRAHMDISRGERGIATRPTQTIDEICEQYPVAGAYWRCTQRGGGHWRNAADRIARGCDPEIAIAEAKQIEDVLRAEDHERTLASMLSD